MSRQKEQTKEFSRMTEKELKSLLMEKKEALRQLRFDLSSGKVKNVKSTRETRKDIARINTVIKLKNSGVKTEQKKKEPLKEKLEANT